MIKIEEKSVLVAFAKGENGAISIGVAGNKLGLKPLTDYILVGEGRVPKSMLGEKEVILEFGNTKSIDLLIQALGVVKHNIEVSNNPLPYAC